MEYQEYPDIQTIEKIAWKEMAGIFFNYHEKKTDFSASLYSLYLFCFLLTC